jgi:transcriptional regulator with XRE-family HTH domain
MGRPTSRIKSETSLAVTRMREHLGESMERFASRMRVSLNSVSRWENSQPPKGRTLERLFRAAKRHGPASSAATLLAAITREKSDQYRRYRTAQIIDEGNVHDLRLLLRELWDFESGQGNVDPFHDSVRREYLLKLADGLCLGGRKEFLGEDE